ncbi:MAG: hypothetical protein J6T96_03440 [Bacteroidales bacterium]|nr:hypothetical protein [Bacteroidales bacterium]MBO7461633.1 hypothetical protein [Bacteroidales bacterium]MBO7567922.1 hypothetical protein [Bacteroidales bacterium]MBP5681886.1 hypothetical protein [Bacteroidales bacterium]
MAEENSFKENLNWKKISIDAVNTIIATAIGIIIGLLVDKWRENISNQENYQKVIVATINNLENYQNQISKIQGYLQAAEDVYDNMTSDEYEPSDETLDELGDMIFESDFMQQDRWIEENFITNGGFIENTDLRLKIGNVYSLIDLCKSKIVAMKESGKIYLEKYADIYIKYQDDKMKGAQKFMMSKDFLTYYAQLTTTNSDVESSIAIIKDLTNEIISMSDADQDELNKMRESSKRINDIIIKNRGE